MSQKSQEILQKLAHRKPLPPLCPAQLYSQEITRGIEELGDNDGPGLKAALHLLNDDIPRCHNVAQAHEGVPTLDYLHAVLHRREGDFWNSKWWFGRIEHPLIAQLYVGTTPRDFVTTAEQVNKVAGRDVQTERLEQKQFEELVKIAQYALENGL